MSSNALKTATPFSVAGHRVDPSVLCVIHDGEEARLEAKAMRVLIYLAEHAGRTGVHVPTGNGHQSVLYAGPNVERGCP